MRVVEDWMDDPEAICEHCEDCPRPNGCLECAVKQATNEDVAKIRGEDI